MTIEAGPATQGAASRVVLPRATVTGYAQMMTRLLSDAQIARYFARLGHAGSRDVSLRTLRDLHRAHLLAIPFEHFDIQLGVPITLDPEAMFVKLVDERRGGWRYEMNGVFGRVLETLGFDVRYLSAAVGRARDGWRAQGNHVVLLVTLERSWIADVGFGDGFLTPLPLEVGHYSQGFLDYRVSRDGPRWRVDNHAFAAVDGYDFTLTPRRVDDFGAQNLDLQTSPSSPFVTATVCQRFLPNGLVALRGATLREVRADGVTTSIVDDAAGLVRVLHEVFDLRIPGIEAGWSAIRAQRIT